MANFTIAITTNPLSTKAKKWDTILNSEETNVFSPDAINRKETGCGCGCGHGHGASGNSKRGGSASHTLSSLLEDVTQPELPTIDFDRLSMLTGLTGSSENCDIHSLLLDHTDAHDVLQGSNPTRLPSSFHGNQPSVSFKSNQTSEDILNNSRSITGSSNLHDSARLFYPRSNTVFGMHLDSCSAGIEASHSVQFPNFLQSTHTDVPFSSSEFCCGPPIDNFLHSSYPLNIDTPLPSQTRQLPPHDILLENTDSLQSTEN